MKSNSFTDKFKHISDAAVKVPTRIPSDPGSARSLSNRRLCLTAPATPSIAAEAAEALASICGGDLRPPDTPGVRKFIAMKGPSTTALDIALDILTQLMQVDSNDHEELSFLRGCLTAGLPRTTVPCALFPKGGCEDQAVTDYILKTYSLSAKDDLPSPKSLGLVPASRSSRVQTFFCDTDGEALFDSVSDSTSQISEMIEESFDTWGFDTFRLARLTGGRPVQFAVWAALRRSGVLMEIPVNASTARHFLKGVEAGYGTEDTIPYHNNVHAADVSQSVFALLGDLGFQDFLDSPSVFSLIFSAAIHDLGHDGRTNPFHVLARDDLALTYNDRSVLENYHVSQAFRIMANGTDADILSSLSKELANRIRKEMIEQVLGTDMAHHFTKVGLFKNFVNEHSGDPEEWLADPDALVELRCMLLHAADISNPAKPVALSDRWVERIKTEMYLQGDEERRLGMPVSPGCDRHTLRFASSQVGFISFIVQPTFEHMATVVPSVEDIIAVLHENMEAWEERKLQELNDVADAKRDDLDQEDQVTEKRSDLDANQKHKDSLFRRASTCQEKKIGGVRSYGEEK